MTRAAPQLLTFCSLTIAGIAMVVMIYEIVLPYRLSVRQEQVLSLAVSIQFYASVIAVALGLGALLLGRAHGSTVARLSVLALVAASIALVLGLVTPQIHSSPRAVPHPGTPNKSLERTATRHGSFHGHMRQITVVADAGALPVAVAQLFRSTRA